MTMRDEEVNFSLASQPGNKISSKALLLLRFLQLKLFFAGLVDFDRSWFLC